MSAPIPADAQHETDSAIPLLSAGERTVRALARDETLAPSGSVPLVEIIPGVQSLPRAASHDLPHIGFVRASRTARSGPLGEGGCEDLIPEADLIIPDHLVNGVLAAVRRNPEASLILAQLLRATEILPVAEALRLESMAYSLLQTGKEFSSWLAERPCSSLQLEGEPTVLVDDSGRSGTRISLNRPASANAVNAVMRTELVSVLGAVAHNEDQLELSGAGRHFCAGGDLREFGLARYPLGAHLERVSQNVPGAVATVAERLTARVHGACIGAGMEISSFASRVIAAPETNWRLPEISMGLLPGCGGTVSIPRRIGRQRMLLLALTGMSVTPPTALAWGLIDEISN